MCNHRYPWYITDDAARYVMATYCRNELEHWRECVAVRAAMPAGLRQRYWRTISGAFDELRAAYRAACMVSAAAA